VDIPVLEATCIYVVGLVTINADVSADARNAQLLADLAGQPVVDLDMSRYRSLRAVRRIGENGMPPALSHNATSVPPQVIQEFVTLHLAIVPA
jgi:hypothetical protein